MKICQAHELMKICSIVGGRMVHPGEHPYQVSIRSKYAFKNSKGHFCGGTIVGKKHVITAAHCADNIMVLGVDKCYIESGSNLLLEDSHAEIRQIESVKKYEGHVPGTIVGDIALIMVKEDFRFSGSTRPIRIATKNIRIGTTCTTCGWGRWSKTNKEFHSNLKSADVSVLYCSGNQRKPGTICAGRLGAGSYHGDSGGPLICNGQLAGVTSGGFGAGLPGVYTNVSNYIDWLKENGVDVDFINSVYYKYYNNDKRK